VSDLDEPARSQVPGTRCQKKGFALRAFDWAGARDRGTIYPNTVKSKRVGFADAFFLAL
jgi:hypothetical protein